MKTSNFPFQLGQKSKNFESMLPVFLYLLFKISHINFSLVNSVISPENDSFNVFVHLSNYDMQESFSGGNSSLVL